MKLNEKMTAIIPFNSSVKKKPNFVLLISRVIPASILLAIMATGTLPADEIRFLPQKVIVFKDGYSLIIKKGSGTTDNNGEIHTREVPDAAVLGSFWATSLDGGLIGMRAGWREDTTEEEVVVNASDNLQILLANEGRKAEVIHTDGKRASGVIHKVLVSEESRPSPAIPLTLPALPRSNSAPAATTITRTESVRSGSHFILRTDAGDQLLAAAAVESLIIVDMATSTKKKVRTKTRSKRLSFRFDKPNTREEITMMYFRPGVRWIPTYRVDLPGQDAKEKLAKLSLQAEILNEAEELIDVPVDIVVGVPNFRFQKTPSPLVLESVLRNSLARAEPALMSQMRADFSNASYSSRSGEFRRDAAAASGRAAAGDVELPGELAAGGAQDLFIYNLPNLRLRKGDRAAVSIFTAKVPYRDVYTWDLHLTRADIATAPAGQGIASPLTLSTNQVWHQIELTNTTKVPWTTGAAMIMTGQQPLAQELLTYTSPKDHCRVPVTVSVETRGSFSETETARELKALRWDSRDYARIKNEATLDLCNNKPLPIDVEISVRLGGRVEKVSHGGVATLRAYDRSDWTQYRGSEAVNNSSRVTWKTSLKAGATFLPKIHYLYYTRH